MQAHAVQIDSPRVRVRQGGVCRSVERARGAPSSADPPADVLVTNLLRLRGELIEGDYVVLDQLLTEVTLQPKPMPSKTGSIASRGADPSCGEALSSLVDDEKHAR